MAALPWMPLYVADYLADTGHLNGLEHGAYLLLIMHYWQSGVLPADDIKLARIARLTPGEWKRARPTVEAFFEPGWQHKRIDAELVKASQTVDKRSRAGMAGASARYGKRNADAMANAVQSNAPSPSPSPSPEEERKSILPEASSGVTLKPVSNEIPDLPDCLDRRSKPASKLSSEPEGFAEFYDIYPRHEAPGRARKAYAAALKKTDAATLFARALVYRQRREGENPEFTQLPATWLHGECWLNEAPVPNGPQIDPLLKRIQELSNV